MLKSTKQGMAHNKAPFKPTPAAGVYTRSDLKVLETTQLRAIGASGQDRVKTKRALETIYNTTRFSQKPGTSTIHGGRQSSKETE
jgi:hypothetical protein